MLATAARRSVEPRKERPNSWRRYPLPKDLLPLIRRYLKHRRDRGPFLFTGNESTNQHGLHSMRVQHLFKDYARAAGLPDDISSHALRHSIAVHALQSGYGLGIRGRPARAHLNAKYGRLRENY